MILSKETAAQRSGLLQIKQAIDLLWLSEGKISLCDYLAPTTHAAEVHEERSGSIPYPYLGWMNVECHCYSSSLSKSPSWQECRCELESYMMIFKVKISYLEKTDWVLLFCYYWAVSLVIFPYLARNTELQNWGLSFWKWLLGGARNSQVTLKQVSHCCWCCFCFQRSILQNNNNNNNFIIIFRLWWSP